MEPYSSPYIFPDNSLHNPFPHSLLRTRQLKVFWVLHGIFQAFSIFWLERCLLRVVIRALGSTPLRLVGPSFSEGG